MSGLHKEPLEPGQDFASNECGDFFEGDIGRWPDPAESYIEGLNAVHLHLGLVTYGFEQVDSYEVCAVIQRDAGHGKDCRLPYASHIVITGDRYRIEVFKHGHRRDRQLVLVQVPHSVQETENVPESFNAWVPSEVRLQPLDFCNGARAAEVCQPPRRPGPLIDPLLANSGYRKGILSARRAPANRDELPDEVVEGGPQVVDGVANNCAEPHRRPGMDPEAKGPQTFISVQLSDDFIRFASEKHSDLRVKAFQMFVCPVELGEDAG